METYVMFAGMGIIAICIFTFIGYKIEQLYNKSDWLQEELKLLRKNQKYTEESVVRLAYDVVRDMNEIRDGINNKMYVLVRENEID